MIKDTVYYGWAIKGGGGFILENIKKHDSKMKVDKKGPPGGPN